MLIVAENIVKRYGNLEVLRHVDLSIEKGKVTAIVGASGAGKTTLLQILGTLLTPDEGRVLYDGKDVTGLKDKQLSKFRNNSVGFVFQNHRLLPEFTIEENVMMPVLIGGGNRNVARERARKLLDTLGLSDRLTHRPGQLSGGECQRAAVARALVNTPSAVLADEPTGSLDTANRSELHKLFFTLRDKLGATFVIVTHDEHLAADCDRVIELADGRVTNQNKKFR